MRRGGCVNGHSLTINATGGVAISPAINLRARTARTASAARSPSTRRASRSAARSTPPATRPLGAIAIDSPGLVVTQSLRAPGQRHLRARRGGVLIGGDVTSAGSGRPTDPNGGGIDLASAGGDVNVLGSIASFGRDTAGAVPLRAERRPRDRAGGDVHVSGGVDSRRDRRRHVPARPARTTVARAVPGRSGAITATAAARRAASARRVHVIMTAAHRSSRARSAPHGGAEHQPVRRTGGNITHRGPRQPSVSGIGQTAPRRAARRRVTLTAPARAGRDHGRCRRCDVRPPQRQRRERRSGDTQGAPVVGIGAISSRGGSGQPRALGGAGGARSGSRAIASRRGRSPRSARTSARRRRRVSSVAERTGRRRPRSTPRALPVPGLPGGAGGPISSQRRTDP